MKSFQRKLAVKMYKKGAVTGIDLGSSSVKLVQFSKKAAGLSFQKVDLKEYHRPADERNHEALLGVLKELIKGKNIKGSKVVVSLNSPSTAVRVITVPLMPKAELMEALKLEAKNYFPFPIEDSIVDFKILGESVSKGNKQLRVAVAVSRSDLIQETVGIFKKLNIPLSSVIPASYALQRVDALLTQGDEPRVHCLLDIGERFTECVILNAGVLTFARKIPVAGNDFTRALMEVLVTDRGRLELSSREAEILKKEVGIPPEGDSRVFGDKISAVEVSALLRTPLEQLTSEIDRSFDYYREETGSGKIDSVILYGRGAFLKGLPEALSRGLGVEVRVGDSAQFGVAMGAALGEGRGINLLPNEIKEKTRRAVKRAGLQALFVGAFLVFALFYAGLRVQLVNYLVRTDAAEKELSSLEAHVQKAQAKALTNRILGGEPYWGDVLRELSHAIPSAVYLTEINKDQSSIFLKGVILSAESENVLSGFIVKLENGIFSNVSIVKSQALQGREGTEFELKCWVD